jgi:hypothetical protein
MIGESNQNVVAAFCLILLLSGCDASVSGPERDNPKDPGSPNWTTVRPFIYDVSKTADNTVQVKWVNSTPYGMYFRIERRVITSGDYTLIGSVQGSAATNVFIDGTIIPVGYTYGYRVGIVGSGGGITYSYDFPIDIF